ncbi:hypothetical protein PUN28_005074 [Cardiocondyla obscurior]|uniref:Uncharacterized protein n=1 Tax=Cardiocondyla obscurior TaxID=286306 RepID=A0AAW2GFQ7_9HYME
MAGGGSETDKRFDQRTRGTTGRDGTTRPARPSKIGRHALLSFSILFRRPARIVVSHRFVYKMVSTYRRRPDGERQSASRDSARKSRFSIARNLPVCTAKR